MRKIDVNCMIGTHVAQELEISNEQKFMEALDYYHIDRAIAIHTMARYYNPIQGNDKLLKLTKSNDRLIPCFVLSPHYKYELGWSALEQLLQEEQIRFAKIYPKEQGFNVHSSHTRDIFDIAARQKVHILIDQAEIVDGSGTELQCFEQLLREYPTVNVILTAIRHRRKMVLFSYLEQYPNFYTEFSVYNNWMAYEETVQLFGSDQILWGSNMPFNLPGSAITMLSYANISNVDKEKIAYRNVEKWLGGSLL